MAEPIYAGNGKKHPKFQGCLSFGFSKEHLKILEAHLNAKGWVNVIISPQKNDKEKYYAKVDTFTPRETGDF
jgi:hypothetical protein